MTSTRHTLLAPISTGTGTIVYIGRTHRRIDRDTLIGIATATDGRQWLVVIPDGKEPSKALETLRIELATGRDLYPSHPHRPSGTPPVRRR